MRTPAHAHTRWLLGSDMRRLALVDYLTCVALRWWTGVFVDGGSAPSHALLFRAAMRAAAADSFWEDR